MGYEKYMGNISVKIDIYKVSKQLILYINGKSMGNIGDTMVKYYINLWGFFCSG